MTSTRRADAHTTGRARRGLPSMVAPAAVALSLALSIASAPVAGASSASQELGKGPKDPRSALQAVQISMTEDGTITALEGRMMKGSATGVESTEQTFDPRQDSSELPVRVQTSYTTEDGSGTDLSEIEGYDGRVIVEVSVQNLTMTPEELTFDARGASQTRTAQVGAPLTVVGAADLGGIAPASVITDGPDKQSLLEQVSGSASNGDEDRVTNGVLGRTDQGTTVVQWAAILAPPWLSATTTLRLVMQGEDLPTPTFDITVFPGLVVDPSLGDLLDRAFNPERSDELQLQSRTVSVIGEVNEVLGRASDTISDVRVTLGSAADTLGRKTVSDLRSTTRGVTTSIRGLQGTLRSLRQGVRSSVQSSSNGTIAQLGSTIDRLSNLLGAPSRFGLTPNVSTDGCDADVTAPGGGQTVAGRLERVVALLGGYAQATGACKQAVLKVVADNIGPAEPNRQKCTDEDGDRRDNVTCSLLGVQDRFGEISAKLLADGDKAIQALDPDLAATAVRTADELSAAVDESLLRAAAVLDSDALTRAGDSAGGLNGALQGVSRAADDLASVLGGLSGQVSEGAGNAAAMQGQISSLISAVCSLEENNVLGNGDAATLRGVLDGGDCKPTGPPVDPDPVDPDPVDPDPVDPDPVDPGPAAAAPAASAPAGDSLADRAARNVSAWAGLSSSISQASGSISALRSAIQGVDDTIDGVKGDLQGSKREFKDLTDALRVSMSDLDSARKTAVKDVGKVAENQETVTAAAQQAFQDAADGADAELAKIIDPAVNQITKRTEDNAATVGSLFNRSTRGLRIVGRLIQAEGFSAIQRQQQVLTGARLTSAQQVRRQAQQALAGIDQVVGGSVRDLESAAAILRRDLTNVLLDLGDPDVEGSGLLGIMSAGAATASSADVQLTRATSKTTSYANQRSEDIVGIALRQAQADASLRRLLTLGEFGSDEVQAGLQTVYDFHIGSGQR